MKNYKLIIQYDGTPFCGWQIQENAKTVQGILSDAIQTVIKEKINLIGSGRTDTGVHAYGQVANFRTTQLLTPFKFVYSVNSILPNEISIISMDEVSIDFHSRFDAKRRIYHYLITQKKSPFFFPYAMFRINNLNIKELNLYSQQLLGAHDFTSFARKADQSENKVCTIYGASWKRIGFQTLFRIEADRYLHSMVRTIVGTLIHLSEKNEPIERVKEILEQQNRVVAAESVVAKGLFLHQVKY